VPHALAPAAQPSRRADPDREFRGPPEEEFWERYNRRLEFPLATVAAVLLHVAVAAGFTFLLVKVMGGGPDKSDMPVNLVQVEGGVDDDGAGADGSSKGDPHKDTDTDPFQHAKTLLPTPETLARAKEDIRRIALDDPNGTMAISPSNAANFTQIDDSLKKLLLGQGRKGDVAGDGKGSDGSKGTGPGGSGADSTRARSLRWVLRFKTNDGGDYVKQLAAMGASILVPLPPENKDCLFFSDLRNPGNRKTATDDDLRRLSGQIKFSDTRPASVQRVCSALGVRESARSFWAFFPRTLEDELSRKELAHRNRRSEDIEETIFSVIIRDGSYHVVVVAQTPKR